MTGAGRRRKPAPRLHRRDRFATSVVDDQASHQRIMPWEQTSSTPTTTRPHARALPWRTLRSACLAEQVALGFEVGAEVDDRGTLRIQRFGQSAQIALVGFGEHLCVVGHDSDENLGLGQR
jgi:hypothetical protein